MSAVFRFACFALAGWMLAPGLAAQGYEPGFRPEAMTDRPAGDRNEVMVLGSPHLSAYRDRLDADAAAPLVDRLAQWGPDAVVTEDSSGLLCAAMRRHAARHQGSIDAYCFDPALANEATGLSVEAANDMAEELLDDWPQQPEPALRRRLAAVFLAAGEPASALVQWLRLPLAERKAEGALTPELVTVLDKRMSRVNETDMVAARVAAKAGLERVWGVDDQSTYLGPMSDPEGYGPALMAAWDNPASAARKAQTEELSAGLGKPGGLLALYRAYNASGYADTAYASDWGPALADPSPAAHGRRYVAYWETRNLRMVANIREILGRRAGTRMLAIVGASHKGYYEAYLKPMRDVTLVDSMAVLIDDPSG